MKTKTQKKPEILEAATPEDQQYFRKLDPAAQRTALVGTKVERTFVVDRADGIDKEARTAWLSIASEEPYERWWGIEILDVRKGSIRDARLESGAPLLVGHDVDDQVGVVERFEITTGKRLRVLARFGRSARAEEIWQDVLDGIRRNTSVGYVIHDLVLEKSEEGINTYRVTDWEPLEGSLVAVPADPTVGVGRAHEPPAAPQPPTQTKEKKSMKTEAEIAAEQKAAADKAAADARAAEQKRTQDLLAAGQEFAKHGGADLAAELIKDPNGSVEKFREKMLAKMAAGGGKPSDTAEPHQSPYGSGARHIIRTSHLRAFIKPVVYNDGTKMEVAEAAYRSGQWLLAAIGNNVRAKQWCREHGLGDYVQERVMTTDVGSAGGYLVPDEMENSIIDLRAAYGLARRLARRRPMASDTMSVPKRTGGVTAYFINEDNSGVTASDKSWGNVNFVAKTLAALSLISKNLSEDAAIDMVDDLAQEQAYAFATKEDQCWLIGDGSSTYGGMQGLTYLFDNGSYASAITAASGHDTFAEYDNADLSAVMAGVADFPGMDPSWLCSKTFAEACFGRLKRTAGGNAGEDLDRRYRYGYGGHPADTSDIMPKVGTSDVTTTEALFGDFSKSSSFGDRRGIFVEVLRERYAEKLQIGILSHERFHIINHDLGDANTKGPVAALKGQ
jgi:HK97 family phage major capsid protein